jgi:hypothetical protein
MFPLCGRNTQAHASGHAGENLPILHLHRLRFRPVAISIPVKIRARAIA